MDSVLLDTSFLICLSTPSRDNHLTAKRYFKEFIDRRVVMYLSTIVVSEYEVRQRVVDLGLENFMATPFNFEDAVVTGKVFEPLFGVREPSDDRVAVKDDAKLMAQCIVGGISHFATDDAACAKRVEALRKKGTTAGIPFAISIQEPYSGDWLEPANQAPLFGS